MEQIIKPISEIAFLNTGLLLLGQTDQHITVNIHYCSLESIQGMAFHLGGEFKIYSRETTENSFIRFGVFKVKINNTVLDSFFNLSEIAYANQLAAFSSDTFICEQGTRLTIIDNSYFVF
jgi:hypothetical protein